MGDEKPKIERMDVGRQKEGRDIELATAFARTSATGDRIMPVLRKCAALVNRDEAAGAIVQRIVGSDPRITRSMGWIFSGLTLDASTDRAPTLMEAVELLGWPMVREVALVVLLHEIHTETATRLLTNPETLDRRALAILSAGTEMGASGFGALFANIGEIAMGLHEEIHGDMKRERIVSAEDVCRAERNVFGFDHGVLGGAMLREVDFPPSVCDEVQNHPTIGTPIWTAEQLANDLGFRGVFERGFKSIDLWPKLKLSERRVARLKATIQGAAELPALAFGDFASAA